MNKAALALLPLLTACSLTNPLPEGAVRFTPPDYYAVWYADMEVCLGETGDYALVEWYKAGDVTFRNGDRELYGLWQPPHRITLAASWIYDRWLVKHEMGHDIFGKGGHPDILYECSRKPWAPSIR